MELTSGEFESRIQKYKTNVLNPATKGKVTNVQKGQHGPATTIGTPALVSQRKNIFPTRLEQQQHAECTSSVVPEQNDLLFRFSACLRSQLTDIAY